jgi:hypothetical protein
MNMYITSASKAKIIIRAKEGEMANERSWARWPARAQSHGLASEAHASRRHCRRRPVAVKTSKANLGN